MRRKKDKKKFKVQSFEVSIINVIYSYKLITFEISKLDKFISVGDWNDKI